MLKRIISSEITPLFMLHAYCSERAIIVANNYSSIKPMLSTCRMARAIMAKAIMAKAIMARAIMAKAIIPSQ